MTADPIDPVALVMVGLGGTIIEVDGQPVNVTITCGACGGPCRGHESRTMQEVPLEGTSRIVPPDPFAIGIDERLRADITRAIIDYARNMPRTLQSAIGPSDAGHPCLRHLAYKLTETPEPAIQGNDVLPSLVGTWAHKGLDVVFGPDSPNAARWIVDRELVAWEGPGGRGHGDAYDTLTNTVVDWKFKGTEAMRDVRKGIISEQYRAQLHIYGLGWENLGFPVQYVCDAFFSRGGNLEGKYGLHPHVERYDRTIALRAQERLLDLETAVVAILELDKHPAAWEHVPATPTDCHFCPWLQIGATDLSVACPGDTATATEGNAA